MPIYVHRAIERSNACAICRDGFEDTRRMSDPEPTTCPACGAPIQQIITPPRIASPNSHRLNENHIEKHGFTQYRKVSKGIYEKTAGKGPKVISDDGK